MPGTVGRSGGNRSRTRGPTVSQGRPERPAWIQRDPIAVEAWIRIVAMLEARRTLSEHDGDAVLLACLAESEYRHADELIRRDGLIIGDLPHPAVKIRADSWKRWSTALSRLGLDPLTRDRVAPAALPSENPFTALKELQR